MNADPLDELLGIDRTDPLQRLAAALVQSDDRLMSDLVRARQDAGLSEEDIAARMDIPVGSVRALERVGTNPLLSTVRRYALAVGVMVRHEVLPLPPSSVDEGNPDR